MNINPRTEQAYRLLHKGTLALARAEQAGIRVDIDYVERKKQRLTQRIERLEKAFKQTKFYQHWWHSRGKREPNINSSSQLAYFLYKIKNIKPVKTTKSEQGSTDEDALQQLNIPELNQLIQIRKLKKIRDTYLEGFKREAVNGYIHPFFNLNLVRTFRSSSDHPNFQNIPKRDEESMQICRRALYPRPGHQLLEVDYSGLEVRIAACYHKDPTMLQYINNPASDMHADMARQIFKLDNFDKKVHNQLRQAAKNGFVFPQFYGDYYKNCATNMACEWCELPQSRWKEGQGIEIVGDTTIADHLIAKGIKSFEQFERHVKSIEYDFWQNRFSDYTKWKVRWWNGYRKYGYIDMLTGFRCSGVMNHKETINYPVQGAAFHCLLWSFIQLDQIMRYEQWDTRLIGQIHDAIVLDAHPDELNRVVSVIRRVTCEDLPKAWNWIIVPLDIDIDICPVDGSWAEKSELKI